MAGENSEQPLGPATLPGSFAGTSRPGNLREMMGGGGCSAPSAR